MTNRNADNLFDEHSARSDISGKVVRGSVFLSGATVGRFVINLGSTVILARLLDPEAYGLLAMVFVVTSFLSLFRDMNLTLATVQRKTITHAQISTIFWFNVAVAGVLGLALLALAPAIAWFYGEPRLTSIAALLTVPIVVRSVADQHKALMRRHMQFGTIVSIDLTAMLVGYSIAVLLAWHGYGYWALVWLHVGTALTEVALCWSVTRWRPGAPVRGSGVREMIAFGASLTGYSIIRYLSRSADNALIGWLMGASVLGIYSKSRDLLGQMAGYAQSPFSAIGVPALSRLAEEPDEYRKLFRRLSEKIILIALPASLLIAYFSEEIVGLLLGPKWTAAAPVMAILSILIFTECTYGCVNWLMISQGRGAQLLRYGIFDATIRVCAIGIGLYWGVTGIAVALSLSAVVILLPAHVWYVCREGPVRQLDVYGMLAPVVGVSLTGLGAVLLERSNLSIDNMAIALGIGLVTFATGMVLALLVLPSGRRVLRDLRRGLEILLLRRSG